MIVSYIIISDSNMEILSTKILDKIQEGYILYGYPFSMSISSISCGYVCQALIKEDISTYQSHESSTPF